MDAQPHHLTPSTPDGARGKEWFSQLFAEYNRHIARYVYRRTTPQDVEDLVADTFATAWRKRAEIPAGFELQWLYRTANFLLANHNRKQRPLLLESFPEIATDQDPAAVFVEDEALRKAFYALSERDRRILLLAAWEGLNPAEIAEVEGISAGAAAVALSRARARFAAANANVDV